MSRCPHPTENVGCGSPLGSIVTSQIKHSRVRYLVPCTVNAVVRVLQLSENLYYQYVVYVHTHKMAYDRSG
jgi:hypothetical protein